MQMIDKVNYVPYGYNPSNKQTVEIPDAEPDEEQAKNDEKEMIMYDTFRAIKTKQTIWKTQ